MATLTHPLNSIHAFSDAHVGKRVGQMSERALAVCAVNEEHLGWAHSVPCLADGHHHKPEFIHGHNECEWIKRTMQNL
eukprot:scaffold124755_cov33-Tisochrysis_lutea.AAC.2